MLFFGSRPILVNGIMYWKIYNYRTDPIVVFSFDLNQEKFQLVKPPIQDPELPDWSLLQFGGCPALYASRPNNPTCPFFLVLEDECWSRHPIFLPSIPPGFEGRGWFAYPVGNLPTGRILLESDECFTYVYLYDHLNNKFERLLVGGKLFSNPLCRRNVQTTATISYLEENLASLEVLFSGF
ncbi:hypothetical protein ACH5RR_019440 [Cinchona calisaya]|uniref:F-box associated beta-propeller type 3 domain-containing protein n=1 Tax=Cinchona calisaya TaxID=153742 RepID=A0ABD2ZR36_9GENT